ncbi:Dynein intermediate chain 2, ciliary, putative [Plasmodium gallinaceum]|uniref:Dynein intermediate chain 2, ciliary, putative n=1 Tax=Plasmodium gallinaceum TaxID=5849 RepID=A0A1J1GWX9_PLAGA|nr:Dynein intermediate chain 2, ciliary, putative [Plasmodium gallinaceum]CRG96767.1 Dynein intermediate chain 2, ciliary, putative [Plasmodium gallinaceum]
MKSNLLEKKKKKKVKGLNDTKGTETENTQNEKINVSNENNKNEILTRFLSPKNPRAFKNLIEFSFSNEEFITVDHIDHTVFHLDLKSCLVMKESDEGKRQINLIKKKIEKANSFTTLKDNDYIYYKPKNCFDYIDRHVQTIPISYKNESSKTEPQEINEICDTVCQSIIYDAYLLEFQKMSNEDEKNEKEKYNNDKKNNDEKNDKHNSDFDSSSYSDDNKIATVLFSSVPSSEKDSDILSDKNDYDYKMNSDEEDEVEEDEEYEEEEEEEEKEEKDKEENHNIKEKKEGNNDIEPKEEIKEKGENELIKEKDGIYFSEKKKKKKKKIKETYNGKHELYFINYKDIKEEKHKQLNFIYHDNKIKKSDSKIICKKSFLKTLKLMDRIYNKNNEEEIYLSYKNKNNKNILTKLWTFSLNAYQLVVTDIKFHPFYEDLFAISFKNNDSKINMGILCCFTFKNTKSPEHFLKTNFHIHSIEWSSVNYSIIIIGLSNGNICIYDLKKKKKDRLIFESNLRELYNRDIISQIIFHQNTKIFYSVSYDGNIFQWKYNNKFTVGEKLLALEKDMDNLNGCLNIMHTQSITCIDFNPFQMNLFLIGTNKGKIYLYSSTYSDHYLNLYNEHSMSINSISYNKFKKNIFISSSYDWTIRIWHQNRQKSLIIFDIKECVYDVSWSPFLSTCFFVISANNCGKIHIYDLSIDINKAIISEIITKKKKLRKLCTNKFNDVVLIGEENGYIYSYKISYSFNKIYMDYLKGKLDDTFQIQIMDSFLSKVI